MSATDWIALATCIATWVYVFLVFFTLVYIHTQFNQQKKEHEFQTVLTLFNGMQSQDLVETRRYIYEILPEKIEGVDDNQLKTHLQKTENAFLALDRIGYLIQHGHIDAEPMMEYYWWVIWRCWKKGKNLISWAREQRGGQKEYFGKLEYLFHVAEDYRIQHEHPEPKIYGVQE